MEIRSNKDRRKENNRRKIYALDWPDERRRSERREWLERRTQWARTSTWSSVSNKADTSVLPGQ